MWSTVRGQNEDYYDYTAVAVNIIYQLEARMTTKAVVREYFRPFIADDG